MKITSNVGVTLWDPPVAVEAPLIAAAPPGGLLPSPCLLTIHHIMIFIIICFIYASVYLPLILNVALTKPPDGVAVPNIEL